MTGGCSLLEAVTPAELADDGEYSEILEDMKEECGRYGAVRSLHIPRPNTVGGPDPPGVGKVPPPSPLRTLRPFLAPSGSTRGGGGQYHAHALILCGECYWQFPAAVLILLSSIYAGLQASQVTPACKDSTNSTV